MLHTILYQMTARMFHTFTLRSHAAKNALGVHALIIDKVTMVCVDNAWNAKQYVNIKTVGSGMWYNTMELVYVQACIFGHGQLAFVAFGHCNLL